MHAQYVFTGRGGRKGQSAARSPAGSRQRSCRAAQRSARSLTACGCDAHSHSPCACSCTASIDHQLARLSQSHPPPACYGMDQRVHSLAEPPLRLCVHPTHPPVNSTQAQPQPRRTNRSGMPSPPTPSSRRSPTSSRATQRVRCRTPSWLPTRCLPLLMKVRLGGCGVVQCRVVCVVWFGLVRCGGGVCGMVYLRSGLAQ